MKFEIMIGMLFDLLSRRRMNANELAGKYGISTRSVYRYVEEMTVSGIPIDVARGSGGGIYISDAYKLPKGFMTREEYRRAIEAMQAMESELADPVLQSAIAKLSAAIKEERNDGAIAGNILVDSGTWGGERKFSEKLLLIERCKAAGTPILCSMGAANKLDPTAFRVADIEKTSVDPLAKVIRLQCRKRRLGKVKVVFSTEAPLPPLAGETGERPAPGRRTVPASNAFGPAACGLVCGSEVVKDLLRRAGAYRGV